MTTYASPACILADSRSRLYQTRCVSATLSMPLVNSKIRFLWKDHCFKGKDIFDERQAAMSMTVLLTVMMLLQIVSGHENTRDIIIQCGKLPLVYQLSSFV